MTGDDVYPTALREREWWVTWILDGAERKRPVAPWQTGHAYPVEWRGDLTGEDRPETRFETATRWVEFDLAELGLALPDDALSDELRLGVILPVDRPPRDERVVLIDWDDVRDPETEEVHPIATKFIKKHGGYVEISCSGEGLHQFVFGGLRHREKFIAPIDDAPFIGDDLPQVEIYDGGRHVAMTGEQFDGGSVNLVDGQECIDTIVSEYADAEMDAGHRTYDPESGATRSDANYDDETVSTPIPKPEPCEYEGPPIDTLRESCPAHRSLAYHAVVEAFCEGYAGVLNWRLEGAAAALGQREGRSVEEIISDLCGDDREAGSVGYDRKTPGRIKYDHARASRDEFGPATWETLASWGVIPPEFVDDVANEGDSSHVSTLPLAQLDALNPTERRRAARKRGHSWPSTDEARDRLFETVGDVIRNEDARIVDAPTALGKSHTVAATRWGARDDITGGRPVVHLLETRDARDEAIDVARRNGGSYHVLLGRREACPVAGGDHDSEITVDGAPASEWFDAVCDGKGVPFSTAHRYLEHHNDQDTDLPCCEDGSCYAIKQWDEYREGPDGDLEYWPLVIATHNFAYAPGLRMHNNIVVDEQPSYEQGDLSTDRVRDAVGAYLRAIDAPVSTWEAFVQLSRHEGFEGDAAVERDAVASALRKEPEREWYFEEPDAHILAPALARAIFCAEERANDRRVGKTVYEPPRLGARARDDDDWNREWVSVVLDENNDIQQVRVVPDFGATRSVVGLDAHPALPLWQANTVPWIKTTDVLDPDERQLWRQYERGLRVVQVGDATRPLSGANALDWLNENKLEVLFEHLLDEYGTQFQTAITTAQVEDRVEELMEDAGIYRPELMHFGEEKSRNDFENERIGVVNGCMDPGDDYVLDLLAELDLDAGVVMAHCQHCDATGQCDDHCEKDNCTTDSNRCGVCKGDGEYRERGRTFDGPDANTAREILASVRENHIAQAAGRYARNADDPESTATVFVRTDAVPSRFADVQVPGVEWVFTDIQKDIVEVLRSSRRSKSAREIADSVGCSKEHVRQTLERLSDNEFGEPAVQVAKGAGVNGASLYSESGIPSTGYVDLHESPTTPYGDSSRWALAIRPPHRFDHPDQMASNHGSDTAPPVWDWANGGDPPPDETH